MSAAPPDSARIQPAGPFTAEVMEFGKHCVSTDGDIARGAEYGVLGRSARFPASLDVLCRPQILGPGAVAELQPVLEGRPHATVSQPVALDGRVFTAVSRTRLRKEDLRARKSRRFWMCRYLAFTGRPPDPLTAYQILEAQPLVGLTREQASAMGRPMTGLEAAVPQVTAVARAFLAEALPLALSGVPVGIPGSIGEQTFFEWASLLWRLLPAPARVLFSAGWCVSPARAETLTLSAASGHGETTAVFDPATQTWTMPRLSRVISGRGEVSTRAFSRGFLVAGTSYARVRLGWTPADRPVSRHLTDPAGSSTGPPMDRLSSGNRALGLADAAVLQAVRLPANRALDELRVGELEEWLAGIRPSGSSLCVDTEVYRYRDTAERAFTAGLAALGDPATRDRGDLVVARSLPSRFGRHHREAVERCDGAGSARARLLLQASDGSPRRCVEALVRAVEEGEAEAFPEEVCTPLFDKLDAALNERAGGAWTGRVVDLLLAGGLPGIVHEWISERPDALAVAVARDAAERAPLALAQIRALATSDCVELVARWATGGRPGASASEVLGGVDESERTVFGRVIVRAWRQPRERRCERRAEILRWVDLLSPIDTREPLIALRQGRVDLNERQVRLLTRDVLSDAVPPEMRPVVGAAILRHWTSLAATIVAQPSSWEPFLREWPGPIHLTLIGRPHLDPRERCDSRVAREAQVFCPRRPQLLKLAREWSSGAPVAGAFEEVAPLLWRWCIDPATPDGNATDLIQLCRQLAAGRLPTAKPAVEEDLDRAARLAMGVGIPSSADIGSLLSHCRRGWQVRLVLSLFPSEDIRLPLQLLETLIGERVWLRGHLASPGVHQERSSQLGLAGFEFHTLKFTEDVRPWWRKGIEQTALWAAFSGVPRKRQGSLRRAVEAYAQSPVQRCRLAALYLEGQGARPPEARERAAGAVMEQVVSPVAVGCGLDTQMLRQVFAVMSEGPSANSAARWRLRRLRYRAFFAKGANHEQAVWLESPDRVCVAPWFRSLLEMVHTPDRSSRLLRIFRREGGGAPS